MHSIKRPAYGQLLNTLMTPARRDLAGSLAAGLASQLVLLISGIFSARILGPTDRGYFAWLLLIPLMLAQVAGMGLPLAVTYYLVRFPHHARSIVRRLLGPAAVQISVALGVQAGLLFVLLHDEPTRVRVGGFISLGYAFVVFTQQFALSLLQGQQRFRAFNILRVMPATVYALSVLTAFLLGVGSLVVLVLLAVATSAAGTLVAVVLAAGYLPRTTSDSPSEIPRRADMIRFGLKGFLGSVSPVDNLRLDQAAIALLLNPVALGLYVVAQSFTNLPRFISQSVGMVAYPHVAAASDEAGSRRAMWRYFAFAVVICGLIVAVLEISTAWLVAIFFGDAFAGAVRLTHILLIGVLFLSARRVLSDAARGANYPGAGSLAEAASWVSLIVGILVLVPPFGVEGVAIALAASWAFSLLVLVLRVAHINWLTVKARTMSTVPPILALAASSAAGVLVVLLPPIVSASLILGIFGLLALGRVRRALAINDRSRAIFAQSLRTHLSPSPRSSDNATEGLPTLRFARVLYYLGLLFIGQLTFRPISSFTVSDWFFFCSFLAASSALVLGRVQIPVRLPRLLLVGILIFSIGGLISTFGSVAPFESLTVILRLVYLTVIWFWLGTIVLQRVAHVRTAVVFWATSAAVNGLGAVVQSTVGNVIPGGEIHWGRVTGFTANINDLGGVMSVAFVPALMLVIALAQRPSRVVLGTLLVVLIAAGLLLSGSVGSVLAALVATGVWFGCHHTKPMRLVAVAALAAACMVGYWGQGAGTPAAVQRIARFGSGSPDDPNRTLDDRLAIYRTAVTRIQKDPVVGVGLDSASNSVATSHGDFQIHNIVLGTWFDAGLLGLAGMFFVFLASTRAAWSATLAARSFDERSIAFALTCALAAFVVFLMSEPALFTRYGWVAAALLFALRAVQVRRGSLEELPSRERSRRLERLTTVMT